jgi:hypothetical protein
MWRLIPMRISGHRIVARIPEMIALREWTFDQ